MGVSVGVVVGVSVAVSVGVAVSVSVGVGVGVLVRVKVCHRTEKHGVSTAYMFMGYLPENQGLYQSLQKGGYGLVFEEVVRRAGQHVKGNVDAELVHRNAERRVISTCPGVSGRG